MNIRTFLARMFTGATTRRTPVDGNRPGSDRRTEDSDQIERRQAWRPTARSAYGRWVQASQHRQAAIEAIHQRGIERGIDARDVLAAYDRLDDWLLVRGWHPDQFDHGFDDDAPIDDFMDCTDVDYDPAMAEYDRRHPGDGDTARWTPRRDDEHEDTP
jgi:hypothetical protein